MWAPIAAKLMKDHTVIVPDLRGMGLSAHPDTGYTKKNQAVDIAGILDHLKIQKADLVTHDIGNMVGYAFAAQYRDRVTRWVVIDAPLPGIGDWDNICAARCSGTSTSADPTWSGSLPGASASISTASERAVGESQGIDEATRDHYSALYAQPHAMHDAFEQFGAFAQDALDNKELLAKGGKLAMPVLALGGEKSFNTAQADVMRNVATNVTGGSFQVQVIG